MQVFFLVLFHGLSIGYCLSLSGFNLYHTDYPLNGHDRDCLYYFVPKLGFAFQFIQYCVRFQLDEEVLGYMDHNNSFTFEELRKNHVSSDQLYEWSAPIDLIEHYQSYLEDNASISTFAFYNCTYPSFGSRCEYQFDEPQSYFGKQVEVIFDEKTDYSLMDLNILPCYKHLPCDRVGDRDQTPGACLDWREVCDGKVDCIDGGHDEELCWQMEMNDCDDSTEYRCHNGLCIPLSFLHDDRTNADCLDQTDEISFIQGSMSLSNIPLMPKECIRDPAFRCEDHRCHTSLYQKYRVECGDGSCVKFTVNCRNKRDLVLRNAFWSGTNISDKCSYNIGCFSKLMWYDADNDVDCLLSPARYINDIKKYCPELIVFSPILFGHVRFIYTNNQTREKINLYSNTIIPPDYICYDGYLCDGTLFSASLRPTIDLFGNNSTCRPFDEVVLPAQSKFGWEEVLTVIYKFFRKCSYYQQLSSLLDNSNLYQCINSSKIISQYRLVDGIEDCFYGDDESYMESCSLKNFNHRFQCDTGKNTKCLSQSLVMDGLHDCEDNSDERDQSINNLETPVSFQIICDGYIHVHPIMIEGRNETDETECIHFSCNNAYTRCDGFWNCPDGADEVNCEWPPVCPPLHHMCLSPIFGNITCLHITHMNNGIDECSGASDERQFCRRTYKFLPDVRYRCWNTDKCIGNHVACVTPSLCPVNNNSSLYFCQNRHGMPSFRCVVGNNLTHTEQVLCTLTDRKFVATVHFSLTASTSYAALHMPGLNTVQPIAVSANKKINDVSSMNDRFLMWFCNRGIMVRRSIDSQNSSQIVCLCPPAYYGHLCQYQNQRVSLTIKVRASFEFRTVFAIIVTLRDDQDNRIESYDETNYVYDRDCRTKFNIYLLYATRPKNRSTNYSVHIDIFNKQKLEYHASWLFPVLFGFLPVYRMAIQLQIPPTKVITQNCATLNCGIHGHCSYYVNTKICFCLCEKGWSGRYCDIEHTCNCSSDSYCFGPNICICPLDKFGPRCYLKHAKCSCQNGGICAPNDERVGQEEERWCLCPKGFSDSKCEKPDTRITLSFASKITIPPSILVHFIEVFGKSQSHIRSTIFKKIEVSQETVSILTSVRFHIVFIEIGPPKTYYMSALQQEFLPSRNLSSTIKHSERCISINEFFNKTFLTWHLIRRIKYYHQPCQQRADLVCFYDEIHMCICHRDLQQANCFTFNHNETYDCGEENPCENQGQCFRDDPNCPRSFMCICNECSHGSRCQFSTKGYSHSLDTILTYHIQPNQPFTKQRLVIRVTTVIITLMLIVGLVSNILCIMTFQTKKAREVGCGYYLLASSFTSAITIILFALKFYFLLVSQMGLITNRNYLTFNCIFIEYLLIVFLSVADWLNAFVGIERVITVVKDTKFNKTQTKQIAKWIIICTFIISGVTHVQDPIYRRLIDDNVEQGEEERRTWCHIQYNSSLQLFNSIILAAHFFLPFILNIISASMIIIYTARQRSIVQKQLPYKYQLRKQLYQLKHLLISPVILILLASPRLVISFLSGCMKTTRGNLWLYLTGYLISFLPSMLLFIVFVMPSETYKNEFIRIIKRYIRLYRA